MTWSNIRLWRLHCDTYPCQEAWVSAADQVAQHALRDALAAGWQAAGKGHRCPEHAEQAARKVSA